MQAQQLPSKKQPKLFWTLYNIPGDSDESIRTRFPIQQPEILRTYFTQGSGKNLKHYVMVDNFETEVYTANQRSHNRLFLNGSEIKEAAILKSHFIKGKGRNTQHYVKIDNIDTVVLTANQVNSNRLFLNDEEIKDKEILKTHFTRGNGGHTKHYVKINRIETEVFTANQRSHNRLFYKDGIEITSKAILKTHFTKGKGKLTTHYVKINDVDTEVFTAAQSTYKDKESCGEMVDTIVSSGAVDATRENLVETDPITNQSPEVQSSLIERENFITSELLKKHPNSLEPDEGTTAKKPRPNEDAKKLNPTGLFSTPSGSANASVIPSPSTQQVLDELKPSYELLNFLNTPKTGGKTPYQLLQEHRENLIANKYRT